MPDPIPFRRRRRSHDGSLELATVAAAFSELDPDDDERWQVLFAEFDHRLHCGQGTWAGIAGLAREMEALAGAQEREAECLRAQARASRKRAARLRSYVVARLKESAGGPLRRAQLRPVALVEP